jgi:Ca2+-binding EF-hand superfamily protein
MNKVTKLTTLIFGAAAIQLSFVNVSVAQPELLELLDTDKDGFISLKEAVGDVSLLENFGLIDTNEDGKLSLEELKAMMAKKEQLKG